MRAFKGVSADGTNRLGKGKIKYKVGKTYKEDESKTVSRGFHCCENPMECLSYYHLGQDRFFLVEAGGSIDEDDKERIACTELTIVEELNLAGFAFESMIYIATHPKREKWTQSKGTDVLVAKDKAEADLIAIARGERPIARGKAGCFIGLIAETKKGDIVRAGLRKVDGKNIRENIWYTLSTAGDFEEVTSEVPT